MEKTRSLDLGDHCHYVWALMNGFRAGLEQQLARSRNEDLRTYLDMNQSLRVLDLGNGRLRPQYALLQAAGHQVYGIDLANQPRASWVDRAYEVARWLYTRQLKSTADSRYAPQTLVCGDVGALPFPDEHFDLVTSVAAFEHFLDVPAVVAELRRVLRVGGMAWVGIHLFTSLSGAHNIRMSEVPLQTLRPGVTPWDHLRERRIPWSVPLNEWRTDQYLETFAQHLSLRKQYCWLREGEAHLTPALESELAAYAREELTCGTYVLVAQKEAA
jgi:SAM-dependent methyltransferase